MYLYLYFFIAPLEFYKKKISKIFLPSNADWILKAFNRYTLYKLLKGKPLKIKAFFFDLRLANILTDCV
jgi:hypothetical protein